MPRVYGDAEAETSPALAKVLTDADTTRSRMGDEYLSIEHLLLALADTLDLNATALASAIEQIRGGRRVTTDNPERLKGALSRIPLGRLGTPRDMAGVALFLASPLSAYVVGQTIPVDGGLML